MYVRGDINLWEKDIYVNYIYQFFINNNFIVYYLLCYIRKRLFLYKLHLQKHKNNRMLNYKFIFYYMV